VVVQRRDDDEQEPCGDAVNARVVEQVRDARNEVFRAYVRARDRARGLADGEDAVGDGPDLPGGTGSRPRR